MDEICPNCGWNHQSEQWPRVNQHHYLDTGRYLSCANKAVSPERQQELVANESARILGG